MHAKAVVAIMMTLYMAGSGPANFDFTTLDTKGAPKGWELKRKDGKPETFLTEDSGLKAFCMKSDNSSFSIQRRMLVDVKEYPVIRWRWKVTELPANGDLRLKESDDQAAQLFVAFGRKSVVYVWDTNAPVGTVVKSGLPIMASRIMVVESGSKKAGRWVTETRDLREDYKTLYGEYPKLAEGIRFQINSQHTRSKAGSCIESVEFRKGA